MKRKIVLILTIIFAFSSFTVNTIAAAQGKDIFHISINGKALEIPAGSEPYIKNNKIMVPFKLITEASGFDATVAKEAKCLDAYFKEQPDQNFYLFLDEYETYVAESKGNIPVGKDITVENKNGNYFIYLDFLAKKLQSSLSVVKTTDKNRNIIYSIELTRNIEPYDTVDKSFAKTTPPDGMKRYSTKNSIITTHFIGSMTNNIGQKPKGNSYSNDMEIFRKLLIGTSYTVSSAGSLQTGDGYDDRSDPASGFVIRTTDLSTNIDGSLIFGGGKYPAIDISDWGIYKSEEAFVDTRILMNFAMEVFKYYSVEKTDGELLWKFCDDHIKARKNIDLSKTYTFGKTKVKFYETPFNGFGIYIVFLTFSAVD